MCSSWIYSIFKYTCDVYSIHFTALISAHSMRLSPLLSRGCLCWCVGRRKGMYLRLHFNNIQPSRSVLSALTEPCYLFDRVSGRDSRFAQNYPLNLTTVLSPLKHHRSTLTSGAVLFPTDTHTHTQTRVRRVRDQINGCLPTHEETLCSRCPTEASAHSQDTHLKVCVFKFILAVSHLFSQLLHLEMHLWSVLTLLHKSCSITQTLCWCHIKTNSKQTRKFASLSADYYEWMETKWK